MSTTHEAFVWCDGCNMKPILGLRFKCLHCDDFDLCEHCYVRRSHDRNHIFAVIETPVGDRAWNGSLLHLPDHEMCVRNESSFPATKNWKLSPHVEEVWMKRVLTSPGAENAVFCPLTMAGCLSILRELTIDLRALEKFRDTLSESINAFEVHRCLGVVNPLVRNLDDIKQIGIDLCTATNSDEVVDKINKWSMERTNMAAMKRNDNLQLVATCVLLFKKSWLESDLFDATKTHPERFFVTSNESIVVQMMHSKSQFTTQFLHCDWGKCVSIDFQDTGKTSALFFQLSSMAHVDDMLHSIDMRAHWRRGTCDVYIPRFTIDVTQSHRDVIAQLGIQSLLSPQLVQHIANVRGECAMTQRAIVEVDEKGARIFSSTTAEFAFCAPPPVDFYFKANSPFFFFVVDATNTICVAAHIKRPL